MVAEDQVQVWQSTKTVGIIGLGDMGLLYSRRLSQAGWRVIACDKEERFQELKSLYFDFPIEIVANGHLVSRVSDFIIYSVEAENIKKIASMYGPSSKVGAIVGGQTSCKNVEIKAFEEYLPRDTEIISVHSLHGPRVSTEGQPLVIINHRCHHEASFQLVKAVMSCLKSKFVYLDYEEHDRITADTQAVTHAAFLSMGAAWAKLKVYPWNMGFEKWYGGLENVKVNISLRIYSNKWHVYAGLAITNPAAHQQILQYATSATELFTIMLTHDKAKLTDRLQRAKEFVFGSHQGLLLLDDKLLDKFSLSGTSRDGKVEPVPNSHLSLLAIVDSWYQLGINPYDHMICSTPLFRVFLGVSEYLFLTPGLLDKTIDAAINCESFRRDDLEFVISAREWSSIVRFANFELYRQQFEQVQQFFDPMFPKAIKLGNEMLKTLETKLRTSEIN